MIHKGKQYSSNIKKNEKIEQEVTDQHKLNLKISSEDQYFEKFHQMVPRPIQKLQNFKQKPDTSIKIGQYSKKNLVFNNYSTYQDFQTKNPKVQDQIIKKNKKSKIPSQNANIQRVSLRQNRRPKFLHKNYNQKKINETVPIELIKHEQSNIISQKPSTQRDLVEKKQKHSNEKKPQAQNKKWSTRCTQLETKHHFKQFQYNSKYINKNNSQQNKLQFSTNKFYRPNHDLKEKNYFSPNQKQSAPKQIRTTVNCAKQVHRNQIPAFLDSLIQKKIKTVENQNKIGEISLNYKEEKSQKSKNKEIQLGNQKLKLENEIVKKQNEQITVYLEETKKNLNQVIQKKQQIQLQLIKYKDLYFKSQELGKKLNKQLVLYQEQIKKLNANNLKINMQQYLNASQCNTLFNKTLKNKLEEIELLKVEKDKNQSTINQLKESNINYVHKIQQLELDISINDVKYKAQTFKKQQTYQVTLLEKDNFIKSLKYAKQTFVSKLEVAISENKRKDNFIIKNLTEQLPKSTVNSEKIKAKINQYLCQCNYPENRLLLKLNQEQNQIFDLRAQLQKLKFPQ